MQETQFQKTFAGKWRSIRIGPASEIRYESKAQVQILRTQRVPKWEPMRETQRKPSFREAGPPKQSGVTNPSTFFPSAQVRYAALISFSLAPGSTPRMA